MAIMVFVVSIVMICDSVLVIVFPTAVSVSTVGDVKNIESSEIDGDSPPRFVESVAVITVEDIIGAG